MARSLILLCLLLAGCQSVQDKLNAAKSQEAVTKARVSLPDWPVYCSEEMPAVIPKIGEKFRHSQARWEVVRDNENARIKWCAEHYGTVKKSYETPR